jgi:hypothetical protein
MAAKQKDGEEPQPEPSGEKMQKLSEVVAPLPVN